MAARAAALHDGTRVEVDDRAVVARQLGRGRARSGASPPLSVRLPRGDRAVAVRPRGDPFPTTYYLTCPHLVAAVSRLEAAGGVERWTRGAATEPALAASLARATRSSARVRRELAGARDRPGRRRVAHSASAARGRPGSLKCLHAHVAFALARPGYELGERVVAELEPRWPDRCCTEPS